MLGSGALHWSSTTPVSIDGMSRAAAAYACEYNAGFVRKREAQPGAQK